MLPRFLILLFALPTLVQAQPHRHLDQNHDLIDYPTLEAWLGRAASIKNHILVSNGLWPMPEKTELNRTFGEISSYDGYTAQGVRLETYPGFYLTGTLYRPEDEGPFPAVLTAHGHWNPGRLEHSDLASIPGRSIYFAQQGYVVFSYSMIGYNETEGALPHRFEDDRHQLWGFSAMGLQLWNSIRALDFLSALPEVDASRIGMTGASGGGTQTFLLTAVDDRIKVAAPVNMISAHFQGGCVCENAPLLRRDANNVEIGAMAAPRPLMMISTSGDWTTNTPEIEYPAIQKIYNLFGAENHVANTHLDYPHNYNKDSREAVYAWFNRWLKDEPGAVTEPALSIPPQDKLTAPLPEDPASLDELFSTFKSISQNQFEENTPDSWSSLADFSKTYGEAMKHVLPAVADAAPELRLASEASATTARKAVLIVHDADSKERAETRAKDFDEATTLVAYLTPYPAGDLFAPPDSISYWTTYNPTVAARRVAEIQASALELSQRSDVTSVELVGLGDAGAWTLLARSQLPFVEKTHIDFNHVGYDADEDYLRNAYIPLLRRAGGFKTAVALTLPSSLTIENLPDGSLKSWIDRLYEEMGAEDLLRVE